MKTERPSTNSSERRRGARLEDVAREAGVHRSTASRVLSEKPGVAIRPDTRERIFAAASRLQYHPNAMARGLKRAQTGAIGFIVATLGNPVYADLIRGAFERAWERDFVLLLIEDDGDGRAVVAYDRLANEGRIDGLLIATGAVNQELLAQFQDHDFPYVFVNRGVTGSGRSVVMREQRAGQLAAEHLLELGHERIAHLSGPRSLQTAHWRTSGLVQTLARAGIKPKIVHSAYEERAGYLGTHKLLSKNPIQPTALVLSNLNQTVGAMASVRELGLRIPDDLSIVACDDHPILEFLEVPVTTIRMPLRELGAAGVDALFEQFAGTPAHDVLVREEPTLIVRQSSAAPSLPQAATARSG